MVIRQGVNTQSNDSEPDDDAPDDVPDDVLGQARSDALPDSETKHWADDGCEVSPTCLQCVLPRCRYDVPGGLKTVLSEFRNTQIVTLYAQGRTTEYISSVTHISQRSVFRILKRGKYKKGPPTSGGPHDT